MNGSLRRQLTGRIPELLRETTFRRYWSAQTISMFGDQISSIALPLVAVLGLHAGAWVDRRGHRRAMMITADVGRAALLTSIPVCYFLGVLTLWQLYCVAFSVGAFGVLFTVSNPTLFVAL